jgi:hypothetical protein
LRGVVYVGGFVRSPHDILSIEWEVDTPSGSGSTECEAWRVQNEIEKLIRGGYQIVRVSLHVQA